MKLNTVNVIEYFEGTVRQVLSFKDDAFGNTEAEDNFKELVNEHCGIENVSDAELLDYVADGVFMDDNGYELYLVHSD